MYYSRIIDSNYFKGRSFMGTNEGETIRVGDAASARTDGYNIVEYNLVEDVITASELEIFSNKSHRNTYRYNTIKNSNGGICLRFGRYCDVYGNFILNDNPARQVAGIRVIDKGHKVFNNYIEGVNGASLSSDQKRASICIYNGNFSDSALGSGEYFAADSSTIAFNTIVNAESGAGVVLGCVHGGTMQPKGLKLSNNLVKMATGNGIYMNSANTSLTQSSEGNIYDTSSLDVTTTGWQSNTLNFGTRTNGILTAPILVQDAAINTSSYVSLLSAVDGQGQTRSATYDVGFDELNGIGTIVIQPLLPTQVGALFYLTSLPVHLIDFSLQKKSNAIQLLWNVTDEINMKQYEVEYSNDGTNFIKLVSIIAQAKATATYTYLHGISVSSKMYYRIKMVNTDGSFVYSPIRFFNNKEEVTIKLFPNPANSVLIVESNMSSTKANLKIINSVGIVVATINAIDFSSSNRTSINISHLKPGLYHVECTTIDAKHSFPFIIANNK